MSRTRPTTEAAPHQRGRRWLILALTAGLVLLLLAGVGIYGLITGPDETRPAEPAATTDPDPVPTPPVATPADVPALPETNDPIRYAEAVAHAAFTWDTGSGRRPLDYATPILSDADPSGNETAGLASDLAGYHPTADAWRQLTEYATTQSLTIENTYIPQAWEDALEQDTSGQLIDGMTAVTIEGTRHRTGSNDGEAVSSAHAVAFTVFMICEPAYERCHVLRLSELDNPMK